MAVYVKTPLRVSLFGGGTDYSEYFEEHGGAVLGGTIDKYIYLVHLPMSPVAHTRYRLTYSKVEEIDYPHQIEHPVIREVLLDEEYDTPFNLAVISDIPGGSGLGSSSAFSVAFINLVNYLKGKSLTKFDLANAAVRVEKELLSERGGVQDQFHAAFGGLSVYEFTKSNTSISPLGIHTDCREALNKSLVLVHTARYRSASKILEEQIERTRTGRVDNDLGAIKALCFEARDVLCNKKAPEALPEVGRMLSETWKIKQSLSSAISNSDLDHMYQLGMQCGAYGGKLAGAGGGGFFIFLAPEDSIAKMREVFGEERVVKAEFQDDGSRLVHMP